MKVKKIEKTFLFALLLLCLISCNSQEQKIISKNEILSAYDSEKDSLLTVAQALDSLYKQLITINLIADRHQLLKKNVLAGSESYFNKPSEYLLLDAETLENGIDLEQAIEFNTTHTTISVDEISDWTGFSVKLTFNQPYKIPVLTKVVIDSVKTYKDSILYYEESPSEYFDESLDIDTAELIEMQNQVKSGKIEKHINTNEEVIENQQSIDIDTIFGKYVFPIPKVTRNTWSKQQIISNTITTKEGYSFKFTDTHMRNGFKVEAVHNKHHETDYIIIAKNKWGKVLEMYSILESEFTPMEADIYKTYIDSALQENVDSKIFERIDKNTSYKVLMEEDDYLRTQRYYYGVIDSLIVYTLDYRDHETKIVPFQQKVYHRTDVVQNVSGDNRITSSNTFDIPVTPLKSEKPEDRTSHLLTSKDEITERHKQIDAVIIHDATVWDKDRAFSLYVDIPNWSLDDKNVVYRNNISIKTLNIVYRNDSVVSVIDNKLQNLDSNNKVILPGIDLEHRPKYVEGELLFKIPIYDKESFYAHNNHFGYEVKDNVLSFFKYNADAFFSSNNGQPIPIARNRNGEELKQIDKGYDYETKRHTITFKGDVYTMDLYFVKESVDVQVPFKVYFKNFGYKS